MGTELKNGNEKTGDDRKIWDRKIGFEKQRPARGIPQPAFQSAQRGSRV
jgi:hypothetical protein